MRRPLLALALAMVLPLPALAAEVVVKPGETLSDIAARYRVSVSTLMKVNGISDPDLVEAGRALTVPGGAPRSRATGGSITVARGETLSEIADRHGISVSRLMQLNGLGQADHIEAGQKLVVPSTGGASPSSGYNRRASEHVVRSGESLSVIADGYGVPLKQLIAINRISDPDHVESGTRLRLKPAATPRPAPAKAAAKPAPPTARPAATAAKPPVARPVAKPQPTAAKPEPKPAPATTVARQAPAAANPVVARATPVQAPIRKPAAVAAAPRPATTATPSKPDWRNYGPLQVDWANWQPMGGSMVAPTLNAQGESLYLAVNCSARKLNATSQAGQWKSWDDPQSDFEQQLVSDLCKARGS